MPVIVRRSAELLDCALLGCRFEIMKLLATLCLVSLCAGLRVPSAEHKLAVGAGNITADILSSVEQQLRRDCGQAAWFEALAARGWG